MLDLAWWLVQHWYLVLFGAAIVVAYIIGGWRLALGIGTLGAGLLLYRQGHKDAEKEFDARADRIETERQAGYDKIDNRNTSRDDVSRRMREGNY